MSTYEEERDAAKALYAQASAEDIGKVKDIFTYAEQHYNKDGWDLLVETWEQYEVYAVLLSVGASVKLAVDEIRRRIKPLADYRADIQAEADF